MWNFVQRLFLLFILLRLLSVSSLLSSFSFTTSSGKSVPPSTVSMELMGCNQWGATNGLQPATAAEDATRIQVGLHRMGCNFRDSDKSKLPTTRE